MRVFLSLCMFVTAVSACKKFHEGQWNKANRAYWTVEQMSPYCKSEIDAPPYNSYMHTYHGYFVYTPKNAPSHYQTALNKIFMFKWHCLKTCVDDFGWAQPNIGIGKGDNFKDSSSPDIVTLKCYCGSGITASQTMRQIHDKWMSTCHLSAITTTTTTTAATTTTTTALTTTLDPTKNYVLTDVTSQGCFPTANNALFAPMTENSDGYLRFLPMSPWSCAQRCHDTNAQYIYAGVTQGQLCTCGTSAEDSKVGAFAQVVGGVTQCRTFIDDPYYTVGSAIGCFGFNGYPEMTVTNGVVAPTPPFTWCGGNGIIEVFKISLGEALP